MEAVFAVIFAAILTLGALVGIRIILGRTPWEDTDLDKILVDLSVPALLFALVGAVIFDGNVLLVLVGSIGMLIVHLGFVAYHKNLLRNDFRNPSSHHGTTSLDQVRDRSNRPPTPPM